MNKVDTAVEGIFPAGNPGTIVADFIPILRYIPAWFPGASWKRTAVRLRPANDAMNLDSVRTVMQIRSAGSAKPSFATAILEEASLDEPLPPTEKREKSDAAGVVYSDKRAHSRSHTPHILNWEGAAGTETTISVIAVWLLAMARHPEVYVRAQAEIDRVVGGERLPELQDRQALPYLECVLKEVYRWSAPSPLNVAHQLTEEETCQRYDLPRGVPVIPNIWAMTRDTTLYDDPDGFEPERFFDIDHELAELRDPRNYVFGHGRRICPGRFLGVSSAWLAIAGVLATFHVSKARDSAGQEIATPANFFTGFIRHPKQFVCDIWARSDESANLILRSSQRTVRKENR